MTCCSHQPASHFGIARVVPKDKLVHLLGNINKECKLIDHFIKFMYVFTSASPAVADIQVCHVLLPVRLKGEETISWSRAEIPTMREEVVEGGT